VVQRRPISVKYCQVHLSSYKYIYLHKKVILNRSTSKNIMYHGALISIVTHYCNLIKFLGIGFLLDYRFEQCKDIKPTDRQF